MKGKEVEDPKDSFGIKANTFINLPLLQHACM